MSNETAKEQGLRIGKTVMRNSFRAWLSGLALLLLAFLSPDGCGGERTLMGSVITYIDAQARK